MPPSKHRVEMTRQGQTFLIPEREFVVFRIDHPSTGKALTLTVSGGGQVHYDDGTGRKHIAGEELVGQVQSLPGRNY